MNAPSNAPPPPAEAAVLGRPAQKASGPSPALLQPRAPAIGAPPLRVVTASRAGDPDRKAGPALSTPASMLRTPEIPLPAGSTGAVDLFAKTPAIRPAFSESPMAAPFRRPNKTAPTGEPAQPAIHVRIGRVEVRSKAPDPPPQQPPRPATVAPLGFARYARQRTYRNWPL